MKINDAKNAFKVGDFLLRNDKSPNKIMIKYLNEHSNKLLTDSSGRVYLIVSGNEIMKIGGSMSRGGIKATISFYVSAQQGGPSLRSFAIHLLIEQELNKNSKVELWMITNQKSKAEINGLNTQKTIEVAAFKESEDLCKEEYKSIMGKYPKWNFQENSEMYPNKIEKNYRNYMEKRSKNL